MVHPIEVKTKDDDFIITMDDFSSLRFSDLYLKNHFSATVRINLLDLTDAYWHLQDCLQEIIMYINNIGGFTVIGWYKRGEINDISNEEVQNQVESSDIAYHIVSISPTNKDLIKNETLVN